MITTVLNTGKKAIRKIAPHYKPLITIIIIILIIRNWNKIMQAINPRPRDKDEAIERTDDVEFTNPNGEVVNVTVTDGQKALIYRIKQAYEENTSWFGKDANERCSIATSLAQMSDSELIVIAKAYHKANGVMLHTALNGITSDPCQSAWSTTLSLGFYAAETDYDKVLKRLESLNISAA